MKKKLLPLIKQTRHTLTHIHTYTSASCLCVCVCVSKLTNRVDTQQWPLYLPQCRRPLQSFTIHLKSTACCTCIKCASNALHCLRDTLTHTHTRIYQHLGCARVCVCHKVNEIAAEADKMFEKRSRHQKALAQMPPNRPEKKRGQGE